MTLAALWLLTSATLLSQAAPPAPPSASAPLEAERILTELAIEAGRNNEIAPIPLLDEQGQKRGELFDRFLLGAIAARAAIARGETPSASGKTMPGQGLLPLNVIAVARSWTCGNRTVAIESIELTPVLTGAATPARRLREPVRGAEAAPLLPGIELPPDALVTVFGSVPLVNASVAIRYAEPACSGESTVVTIAVRQTPFRASGQLTAKLPPEAADLPSPTVVRVRGAVDRNGQLREASAADAPAALASTALEMARKLRLQPPTVNGVATVQLVALPITFTTTGQPAAQPPAAPTSPTVVSPGLPPGTPSMTGRTHETKTRDVPGLTREASRCAIADDEEYGRTPEKAIRIGGGVFTMVAREMGYMNALRGPTGQGIHFFRRGSSRPMDGLKGPLDIYEVTYPGLERPVVLYLDVYDEDELKAPAGFVCATELRPASKPAPGPPTSSEPISTSPPSSAGSGESTTRDVAGLSAASSQCAIASDETYGYSSQNAVKIGGEMTEGDARIQQFLQALRGPNGEGLRFKRTGSQLAPDAKTVLVVYELTHVGLAKPVRLYLDRFHLDDPKAPKGLVCATPIGK